MTVGWGAGVEEWAAEAGTLRADALRDLSPVGERQVIPAVTPFLLPGEKVRVARMRGEFPATTGIYPSP